MAQLRTSASSITQTKHPNASEITACLVILKQLAQPVCRCLTAFESIVSENVTSLQPELGFFFHTAEKTSKLWYSEQRQCDLLKGDLKVFVYPPLGHERKHSI